jgi:SpoU rRNA methylase family enzyme
MKWEVMQKKLSAGKTVYILEDFYDAVIRLVPTDSNTISYIKHKGRREIEIDHTEDVVMQIKLGGTEITKEEYDRY